VTNIKFKKTYAVPECKLAFTHARKSRREQPLLANEHDFRWLWTNMSGTLLYSHTYR